MCHYLRWALVPLCHGPLVDQLKNPAPLHTDYPKPTLLMVPVDQTPCGVPPSLEKASRHQRGPLQMRLSKALPHLRPQNATADPCLFQRTCHDVDLAGILVHPGFGPQSDVDVKVEAPLVQGLEPALSHAVAQVPLLPLPPFIHLLAPPSLA